MILSNSKERLSLANHLLTLYIYYNDIASVFFSEIILYLFLNKNVNRLIKMLLPLT